jgi:predicted RecB family nuclease
MDDGACANATIEVRRLFFTDADRSVTAGLAVLEAKAICATCPVTRECLTAAIDGNMFGIWGGTTRREREQLAKAGRRKRIS